MAIVELERGVVNTSHATVCGCAGRREAHPCADELHGASSVNPKRRVDRALFDEHRREPIRDGLYRMFSWMWPTNNAAVTRSDLTFRSGQSGRRHARSVNRQPGLPDRDVEPGRRDQCRRPGVDHAILRLHFAGNAGQRVLERHAGQQILARAAGQRRPLRECLLPFKDASIGARNGKQKDRACR